MAVSPQTRTLKSSDFCPLRIKRAGPTTLEGLGVFSTPKTPLSDRVATREGLGY